MSSPPPNKSTQQKQINKKQITTKIVPCIHLLLVLELDAVTPNSGRLQWHDGYFTAEPYWPLRAVVSQSKRNTR